MALPSWITDSLEKGLPDVLDKVAGKYLKDGAIPFAPPIPLRKDDPAPVKKHEPEKSPPTTATGNIQGPPAPQVLPGFLGDAKNNTMLLAAGGIAVGAIILILVMRR